MPDGARARVEYDWMLDGVRLRMGRLAQGRTSILTVGPMGWRDSPAEGGPDGPQSDEYLHLPDDIARALYEALAEHYGHSSTDTRHLRMDYDAERSRVDKLLAYLTRSGA